MTDPSWGSAILRTLALLAKSREAVAATRNHRHVAVIRRALREKRGPRK